MPTATSFYLTRIDPYGGSVCHVRPPSVVCGRTDWLLDEMASAKPGPVLSSVARSVEAHAFVAGGSAVANQ